MTTTMTAPTTLPTTLRTGLARGGVELRQFFRQKEYVVFTFTLPALLLVLLGSILGDDFQGTGISTGQVLAASMIGAGIMSTSFVSMGTGVALDRHDGTLKRLRGTPMTAAAYFLGKIILVAVASLAEVVLLLAVGMVLFDLPLPSTVSAWLTFGWIFVLAVTSCTLLGIAASSLAKSPNGASAGSNVVYLALQFTSGVFVNPISALPAAMVAVSSLFPLKWICQGLRSVFLPDEMARYEMAGQWELGLVALVLSAWCVLGLLLCRATFRWTNRAE